MTIERINLRAGQRPTETDWEGYFNNIIDEMNDFDPANLRTTGGRVGISISGDAATLNGLSAAEIIGGDFPEVMSTLRDMLLPSTGFVLSGGVATQDLVTANQLNVTAIKVLVRDGAASFARIEIGSRTLNTTLANQLYYLDVLPGSSEYQWSTTHSPGDYTPIAEVATDASANIAVVTDKRILTIVPFGGLDGQVAKPPLTTGEVTESKIDTGAVTEAKIGTGAVVEAKIGTGAVTEVKIGERAVTFAKLGTDTRAYLTSMSRRALIQAVL